MTRLTRKFRSKPVVSEKDRKDNGAERRRQGEQKVNTCIASTWGENVMIVEALFAMCVHVSACVNACV